jgi:hypothetical protein
VSLLFYYSYRVIGKLTVFFQIQEFILRNTDDDGDQLYYHRVVFSSHLKSKCDNILDKVEALRITLNINDTHIISDSSRLHDKTVCRNRK